MQFENLKNIIEYCPIIATRTAKENNCIESFKCIKRYVDRAIANNKSKITIIVSNLSLIENIDNNISQQIKDYIVDDIINILILSVEKYFKEINNIERDIFIEQYLNISDDKLRHNILFQLFLDNINVMNDAYDKNIPKIKNYNDFKMFLIKHLRLTSLFEHPMCAFPSTSRMMMQSGFKYKEIMIEIIEELNKKKEVTK
ncbi:MAG: hypothetical protein IKT40_09465 [Bacilli bacterium]|nr:hypothetical protein [Bacilli bacterium]